PVAEETASTACATYFRGSGAGAHGPGHEVVDAGRGHARCEALASRPLAGDVPSNGVVVSAAERITHAARRIADLLEQLEDLTIAVEMTFGDVPVVRPRVAWRAGIGEDDALLELPSVHVQCDAPDAVDSKFHGGDASVKGRAIVLDAG